VGLPMKKLRRLLALVVPLLLLVSMPLLLTHVQAQEEGNDIWRLTMVVMVVPSNIPSMVLEIYKGSGHVIGKAVWDQRERIFAM